MAFREDNRLFPTGAPIVNVQWDNAYLRSHQEPRTPQPSSPENTILDQNYLLNFQRGFFIQDAAQVAPVNYRNAMTNENDPERRDDNIVQMRWLVQRRMGLRHNSNLFILFPWQNMRRQRRQKC